MSISRLLAVSLLLAVNASALAQSSVAQSSPQKNATLALSPYAKQANSQGDLLSPKTEPKNFLDPARIEEYSPRLSQLPLPPTLRFGPDGQAQDSSLCYSIRSYKVARDDSRSDSTHPVGHTTCTSAARFRTYTIELRTITLTP